MNIPSSGNSGIRKLTLGWWMLALFALTVSTAFAVLLVVARAPLFEQFSASTDFFREALVMHVNLAVVVWFLASAAGAWTTLASAAGLFAWVALAISGVGLVLMILSAIVEKAVPLLANYVPVLDSTPFLAGLLLFFAGVVLCGLHALMTMKKRTLCSKGSEWRIGVGVSIFAALLAAGAFLVSISTMHQSGSTMFYEALAWAPGHVLQFVHVILLMSAWIFLSRRVPGGPPASRRFLIGLYIVAALPLLMVPVIYALYQVESLSFRQAFTLLMSSGIWPAPALLGLYLLNKLARARVLFNAESAPLALSILLFLAGCFLGAFIRGDTTMVPAHYHCTVGAVTLAYMAIGYRVISALRLGSPDGRLVRVQPLIYGGGLLTLALALAWSGWMGVPRKTMSVELAWHSVPYLVSMGLAGIGGLLAILGSALFVFNLVRAIHRRSSGKFISLPTMAPYPRSAVFLSFVVVSVAMLVGVFHPTSSNSSVQGEKHAREEIAAEVAQRFQQGVMMLHAKHPEEALTAFHRVIELAPELPEAHVNIGYALLQMKRYEAARDFFESATALRPNQINAYYGLAEALEGLHDLPAALGAMRTYMHLAPANSPFRRKAEAAVWEWESALKKTGSVSAKDMSN